MDDEFGIKELGSKGMWIQNKVGLTPGSEEHVICVFGFIAKDKEQR